MAILQLTRQAVQSFTALAIFPVESRQFPCLFKPAASLIVHHRTHDLPLYPFLFKHEGKECVEHCKIFSPSFSLLDLRSAVSLFRFYHQLLYPFFDIKWHCTLAKTLLMWSWMEIIVLDALQSTVSLYASIFHSSLKSCLLFCLDPILNSYWETWNCCLAIYSTSYVFPIWAIEYTFVSENFMLIFVEGYFSFLLWLGKTSSNSYPSLHLITDICVSFQICKVQVKLSSKLLTIGKDVWMSFSVLQLSFHSLKLGTFPSLSLSLTSMVFKSVPSL